MHRGRVLVGSLGSLVWPAVVVLIPAGITFASARVFAESAAPPPPSCSAPRFVACDGGTENSFCTAECSDAKRCVCTSRANASGAEGAAQCNNGTSLVKALECASVYTCEDYAPHIAACAGKAVDTPCMLNGGNGFCRADTCMIPGNGGLEPTYRIFCSDVQGAPPDPTSVLEAGVDPGFGGPTKSDAGKSAAPASAPEDSGCSTASSPSASLLGVPLLVGLLLGCRRKSKTA